MIVLYRVHKWIVLFGLLIWLGNPSRVVAQPENVPEELIGIDVNEQLGAHIPLDLTFLNEAGEQVVLEQYFDGERPVILNFVYHDCPMLCSMVLDGLTNTLKDLAWVPGEEFEILTVSFSPSETPELAQIQKERYLNKLGNPAASAGWHYLVGQEEQIARLAEATGFVYEWMPDAEQYAHPAVLVFASGSGKITRYLYGIQYQAFNVRNTLIESAEGQVGQYHRSSYFVLLSI